MSKWKEKRLGELIEINPETLSLSKNRGKINYIDISSVNMGRLSGYAEYDVLEAPSRARRIIRNNDIIFSTVRPNLRAYHYVRSCPDNAVCSTGFAVLRAKKEADCRFIYSLVTGNSFVDYLTLVAKGSAYPAVDVADFRNAKVMIPDLPTQKRIAHILSAYDDLIENNNKKIKVLEQMAENLYKEWFVRFRFPGHEKAEFENGIPKGWEVKRLEDFCYVTDGTHDTPSPTSDGFPLITGKHISDGDINFDEAYLISEEDHKKISKRSGLASGDILFSNIGTVGKCCIVNYDREFSVKNVIIFKLSKMYKSLFLYHALNSSSMQELFQAQTNGASQQFVGLTFMRRFKLLIPSESILQCFYNKISDTYTLETSLKRLNKNLIKQRDLLLPRLMSGKLEV